MKFDFNALQEGLDDVIGRIDVAVREVIGPLTLKKELSVRDILGLIMVIRDKVNCIIIYVIG